MKKFSLIDQIIIAVDNGMRSIFSPAISERANPGLLGKESYLTAEEKKHSVALMRVNHAGEVCAQALYFGQALVAKSATTQRSLLQSAQEENDHLAWCQERIRELAGHTSFLNPVWYTGSLFIGLLAGMVADKWSLGFVVETEKQVEQHLQRNLNQLPAADDKSRLILEQMRLDEEYHGAVALKAGARELPQVIKKLMQVFSKIMTTTTYYI